MDQVALAESLARKYHAGQVDQSGHDYIGHPERVAKNLLSQAGLEKLSEDDRIAMTVAAWLHDVIEDCNVSRADLSREGISDVALDIVDLMTKPEKVDGKTPDSYLANIAAHPLANRVKLADLADNLNEERLLKVEEPKQQDLRDKYAGYRKVLKSEGELGNWLNKRISGSPDQA